MDTRRHHRYLIATAALVAAGLCLPSGDAAAVKVLGVDGSAWGGDPNCTLAGQNTMYYMEAWGFDGGGVNKVCEVAKAAGGRPALGRCEPGWDFSLAPATQHEARITIRGNTTGNWASALTVAGPTARQTNWGSATATLWYTIGALGNCPAVTLNAASRGIETP